jgi:hypothetical protein
MTVLVAALLLLILAVVLARTFSMPWIAPWALHLDKLQALLTVAGIMVAAVWYFFERPQAAKLDLDQAATGVALSDERVMILIEVSPKNLGGTAIDFRDAPYTILVHQVTPLTRTPAGEFEATPLKSKSRAIHSAETWSPIATISSESEVSENPDLEHDHLTSFIEAGETENLYFRTIIPCKPGLRVYVTSQFRKPDMWYERPGARPALYWVKHTFLDLSQQCPESTSSMKPKRSRS